MKILFFLAVLTGFLFPQELHLKEGMTAPDFKLQDQDGRYHSLTDYRDTSLVVLFFYPKAGTSGCTVQACGIRDSQSEFEKSGLPVFGISTDSIPEIQKFAEEHSLKFPLLSDYDKKVTEAYGVLRPSGRSARVTFIINKDGKIADILEVKDVETHAAEVLKRVQLIQ